MSALKAPNLATTTIEHIVDDLKDDPDLVSKLHSLLAERDPDVLAYAAQLGDEHVIREFLKNAPNEVRTAQVQYNNLDLILHAGQ